MCYCFPVLLVEAILPRLQIQSTPSLITARYRSKMRWVWETVSVCAVQCCFHEHNCFDESIMGKYGSFLSFIQRNRVRWKEIKLYWEVTMETVSSKKKKKRYQWKDSSLYWVQGHWAGMPDDCCICNGFWEKLNGWKKKYLIFFKSPIFSLEEEVIDVNVSPTVYVYNGLCLHGYLFISILRLR